VVSRLGPLLNKDGPAILQQFGFSADEIAQSGAAQEAAGEMPG
jgi:hypothetical protein